MSEISIEEAEDAAHAQWLDAIGTAYQRVTGKPWDTLDGETTEESVNANVGALFNWIEEFHKRSAAMSVALTTCKDAWADYLHNKDNIGWAIEELIQDAENALQPDAGARYLSPEQVRPLVEALQMISGSAYAEATYTYVAKQALEHAKSLGL